MGGVLEELYVKNNIVASGIKFKKVSRKVEMEKLEGRNEYEV